MNTKKKISFFLISSQLILLCVPCVFSWEKDDPPVFQLTLDGNDANTGSKSVTGSFSGGEIQYGPGVKGSALYLDGSARGGYEFQGKMPFAGGFTLELWFKRDMGASIHEMDPRSQRLASSSGYSLYLRHQSRARSSAIRLVGKFASAKKWTHVRIPPVKVYSLSITKDSSTGGANTSPEYTASVYSQGAMIVPDVWIFAALVYDPEWKEFMMYLDGAKLSSRTEVLPNEKREGNVLYLGLGFKGFIDEIKLYDYARTEQQIRETSNDR